MTALRTRFHNALLGVAIGDALGWPQERPSRSAARPVAAARFRDWTRFHRHRDPVPAGTYSDDTQLTLAVARSCLADDWWHWLVGRELPCWPLYQRGGGRAGLSAARRWSSGVAPWRSAGPVPYFRAGANGAAMRILPHVMITVSDRDSHRLMDRVVLDAIATHGHPRALVGATMHAIALRRAFDSPMTGELRSLPEALLDSDEWSDLSVVLGALPADWITAFGKAHRAEFGQAWRDTVAEARRLLTSVVRLLPSADPAEAFEQLGCLDSRRNGAGHLSAAAALYAAARWSEDPITAVTSTAFLAGADTDTLASMTAALLGAGGAESGPPNLVSGVQDREYLSAMAERLADGDSGPGAEDLAVEVTARRTGDAVREVRAALPHVGEGDRFPWPDGRTATVSEVGWLGMSRRFELDLDDGQTGTVDVAVRSAGPDHRSGAPQRSETDGVDEPGTRQSEPAPVHHLPMAAAVDVVLPIADADRTVEFLRCVTGKDVEREPDGSVRLGDQIVLREAPISAVRHAVAARTVWRFRHPNPVEAWRAVERLDRGSAVGVEPEDGAPAYLRCPDGYRVLVSRPDG